jgi:hypothetical protein
MPPKKAKVGRPAANKVTKPAPKASTSTRRDNKRIAAAVEEEVAAGMETGVPVKAPGRGKGRKRAAAAEEEEEVEDTVMTEETPPATKQKGARGRPKKVVIEAEEPPAGARRGRKAAGKKAEPEEEVSEIPETQQPEEAQSDSDDEHDDLADLPVSRTPERAKPGRGGVPAPSSASKRPLHSLSPEKGDPVLRRRLGEMTQKYENLEHRYRDLKEVAVREAERNFDKLKKQSEDKSKGELRCPSRSLWKKYQLTNPQRPTNSSRPSKPSSPHKKKPIKRPSASKSNSTPANPKPIPSRPSSPP